MDLSPPISTPMEQFLGWALLALCLAGPVGLVALRHHFSDARGRLLAVKSVLVIATVVSSPVLAVLALTVVVGGVAALALPWNLLKLFW